jgi:apolipoprotein N-acyltransferase
VTFPAITTLWPVVFPYTPVIGFATVPQWIQVAELGGAPLVEWQAILCGLLLVEAVRRSSSGPLTVLCVALAVSVPLASTVLGGQRMRQLDREARGARKVTFGIVQPNTPVTQTEPDVAMNRLREPSREAQEKGAQIVVWPEAGTYPFMLPRIVREDPSDPRGQVLLLHQVPTLFGAVTMFPDKELTYNTFFHLDEDGKIRDSFDKVVLVPFGENIPFIDSELAERFIRNIGQLARGAGAARFMVRPLAPPDADPQAPREPVAIGPMICIEDIHTGFARSIAIQQGGVQIFVNATIDGWYGAGQEPWEHLALAQFRSVEHRIPMVRSVSTGVSAVIDHAGRLAAQIPSREVNRDNMDSFPPELLVHRVALPRNTIEAPTIVAQLGWQLPRVCQALVIAGGALWAGLLWIRRRQLQETVPAQGQIA